METKEELYNIFLEKQESNFTKILTEKFNDLTDEQLLFLEDMRRECFNAGFEISALYAKYNK